MDVETTKDVETIEREILISQKIDGILRKVEGQVLVFKQHYRDLTENLSGIDKEEDLKKIENCLPQLYVAVHVIDNEIKEYDSMKGDLERKGITKDKVDAVRAHVDSTKTLLHAYIMGIQNIKQNLTGGVISIEKAKEILNSRIKSLEDRYNAFFNVNDLHIRDLKGLLAQIGRN